MVLSRKRKQKLRAELNNKIEAETPEIIAKKNENVTGKKRKLIGQKGSEVVAKLEAFLLENGETELFHPDILAKVGIQLKNEEAKAASLSNNDDINVDNKAKKPRTSKKLEEEDGSGLIKEEKVASLKENDTKKKQKKKKKKVRKKKKKVDVQETPKSGVEIENGGVLEKEKLKSKPESEVEDEGVLEQEKPPYQVQIEGISEQMSQGNSDGDAKKVYVGGMPYYSTEEDIRSYFGYCGAITDIDCMTFPESGKFRGIAIISFETEEAVNSALELDGTDMEGLYLTIQPYKTTRPTKASNFSPPVIEGYYRIYAGNLSWDITEADLRNLFSDCNISSIRFGEDKETGNFKGYAHVDFADDASLNKALKLDQKFVCGRPVKINRAVPKKGAVRNGVTTSTVVKPANSKAVNPAVTPENNGAVNSAAPPENYSAVHSSLPPENKSAVNSAVPPASNSAVHLAVPPENDGGVNSALPPENNGGVSAPPENNSGVSARKLKRRTCYECGERGHILSDCPKKQNS